MTLSAECIALAGLVLQGVIGFGAIGTALWWHRQYYGRRRAEAGAELALRPKAFMRVMRAELNAEREDEERGYVGSDPEDLDILRRTSVSSDEAWRDLQNAWGRAEIDFPSEEMNQIMVKLESHHWNWVMVQNRRGTPLFDQHMPGVEQDQERLRKLVRERLVPIATLREKPKEIVPGVQAEVDW